MISCIVIEVANSNQNKIYRLI